MADLTITRRDFIKIFSLAMAGMLIPVELTQLSIAPGTPSLNDGKWHHICMTWDRNNSENNKMYIDGQEIKNGEYDPKDLPVKIQTIPENRIRTSYGENGITISVPNRDFAVSIGGDPDFKGDVEVPSIFDDDAWTIVYRFKADKD